MDNKTILNSMQAQFLSTLLEDLNDPNKCTPGLYQVIRGVIQDNKDLLDLIPNDFITTLENKLSNTMPFKIKNSVA